MDFGTIKKRLLNKVVFVLMMLIRLVLELYWYLDEYNIWTDVYLFLTCMDCTDVTCEYIKCLVLYRCYLLVH